MKKFLTVALAGVLAASMLFTGCSKKEESKVPDKLIVGTNAEFPPFEYMNDKKQPDGFDIAMIKEIGKRMDKKVEIQNMEFKSLIGAMESDSINTIIAGMTKTKERQKSVDFSDSYYTSNQAIILKKDSKIKKLSQLEGKKVGVQEGTTGDIIASGEKFGEKNKVIVKTDVKRYKKGVDAVMDLKNGAIDAVVIDEKPAQEFVKNNAKKLKLVVDSAGAEYYCIAITKGNTAYKEEIKEWMAEHHMEDAKTKAAGKGKHIFSHVEWHMEGVRISLKTPIQSENYVWVLKKELENTYALPSAFEIFRKIL